METAPSTQEDYTSPVARAEMFSVASLVMHIGAAVAAAIFVIILALLMPWRGGVISDAFEISFILAVLGSVYALAHGYIQVRNRGLGRVGNFLWHIAIGISVLLGVDIILLGMALHGTSVTFPGSDILSAPDIFFFLILFQSVYFIVQSILASATARHESNMRDWYTSIYLLILAINTASIIFGPVLISYF